MDINILKDLKVLLVEDEDELSTLLKDAMGEYFYSFTIAKNGAEGLEKFAAISPDIVITDINMPEMSGLEMSEILRKTNPKLPIIILSAFSEKEYLLSAIDVSVMKYFIKPFDPDELLEYLIKISKEIASKNIKLQGGFKFDKNSKTLTINNKFIALSKREISFIEYLIEQSPKIIEEKNIKSSLWPDEEVSSERIRTFIKRLRDKTSKTLVNNIKGQGYQIIL